MAKFGKAKSKPSPKSKPALPEEVKGAPVCIAALFCGSAIIGEDRTVTIIRTLDTITFAPETDFKLGNAIDLDGEARLVVMLKRDNATGRHELSLVFSGPSGKTDVIGTVAPEFREDTEPEAGYNLVAPIRFVWRGEGLYWLQVRTKTKKIIGRTALRLKIAPKKNKD